MRARTHTQLTDIADTAIECILIAIFMFVWVVFSIQKYVKYLTLYRNNYDENIVLGAIFVVVLFHLFTLHGEVNSSNFIFSGPAQWHVSFIVLKSSLFLNSIGKYAMDLNS